MKKLLILICITQFGFSQMPIDSTWYYEQAMWDSLVKTIERAEREQHTVYYSLSGAPIPKTFNEVIIEMVYDKPRKIYIQK